MSAEAVSSSLSRMASLAAPHEQPASERTRRSRASVLLEKRQASARGEGSRREDTPLGGSRDRNPDPLALDPRPSAVRYPPPGPSLPPPLVPIRDLPPLPPPDWLEATDRSRAIERRLRPEADPASAVSGAAAKPPDPTSAGEPTTEAPAAIEAALSRLVFAQGRDARPVVVVDTALAGQLFDARV